MHAQAEVKKAAPFCLRLAQTLGVRSPLYQAHHRPTRTTESSLPVRQTTVVVLDSLTERPLKFTFITHTRIHMGLFGDFKASLAESPGRILWTQLQDTQQKMARLNPDVCANALNGFVKMRDTLVPTLDNMTKEGQLKTARQIQDSARQTLDLDVGKGYALWLTGAWLESMNRPGIDAAKVCDFLDQTALAAGGLQY